MLFWKTNSFRLTALVVVTVGVAQAFTTRPTMMTPADLSTTTTTRTPTRRFLSLNDISNAEDAIALVQDTSSSLWNIISNAESPMDAWEQFPLPLQGAVAAALALPIAPTVLILIKSVLSTVVSKSKNKNDTDYYGRSSSRGSTAVVQYPEGQPATYELNDNSVVPFEFGPAAQVRPLLKQTQLETRPLQVVYDANRDGYDATVFHSKVDGKGAAVVLAKVAGQWCGGYNPRGWASLGQARSSVAAFLFYKKAFGGWQKIRVSRTGSMACGNDLYDAGIYFGADSFVIPLRKGMEERKVTSRLGQYFEPRPDGKLTILPRPAEDFKVQELKVLTGVYAPGEDIPNSGGVLELGQF